MKITAILLGLTLILSSCHKHEEIIVPEDYYEYGDINKLFKLNLEDIKVVEPFDIEKGLKYAINNKAEINIPGGCLLTINNEKVNGEGKLSFIEIYDKGTMALTNKTTTAAPYTSPDDTDKYITQTAGIFEITASQNQTVLKIGNCTPKIITQAVILKDKSIPLFIGEYEGIINNENNVSWLNMRFPENNFTEPMLSIKNLGWNSLLISPAVTYNKVYTTINFQKPKELDNSNSRIFIAVEGEPNKLGNSGSLISTEPKYHFILIAANTNSDGFKYVIIKSQTIKENQIISFTKEHLKEATPHQLRDIINELP